MLEMMQKVAEEKCLALFLQADHGVELGFGSFRNDVAQERDVSRRHFHVHQKVGAVGREDERERAEKPPEWNVAPRAAPASRNAAETQPGCWRGHRGNPRSGARAGSRGRCRSAPGASHAAADSTSYTMADRRRCAR